MQFEYDPEFLINEVKKRPGLWDYEHAEYRMKHRRIQLWGEVVKELMQTDSDVTMTKGEIRELELQLQKKWKSIRDCFQKYLANPNRTKRPYLYSKHLQFLLKDQKMPKRSSAVAKEDTERSSESEEEDERPLAKRRHLMWRSKKTHIKINKKDDCSDDDENNDDEYNIPLQYESPKIETQDRANMSSIETNQFAFANVDAVKDTDDPDKMFLLSLLPHLKSLPEEFRLNAKMELMQVLQQANFSVSKLI